MRLAALAAATAVLLSACSPTSVRLDADDRDVRLRVVMADDWAATGPVDRVVRAFEAANPGVRVEVDGLPFAQVDEAVDASIRSGQPYDLAQWHAFAAGARGLAEPLDEVWDDRLDADEFLPGAVGDVRWGDAYYGIPLDVNAMVLMANRDHLDESGVDPSSLRTFDDLEAAAAALTLPDDSRRGFAQSLSSWSAYGWIRANGGEVVEVDAGGRPTFLLDDPRTVAAVDLLARLIAAGHSHRPGTVDRSIDTRELFGAGDATLIATGSWDLVDAGQSAALEGVQAPTAVALPVPVGPDADGPGTALGGSSLFVPRGAANRELAVDFALALIADDVALELAEAEGRLPARRRVWDAPFFATPTMRLLREHLEVASPMRLIAFDEAQLAFTRALERVLGLGEPAAEALAEAQAVAEASTGGDG